MKKISLAIVAGLLLFSLPIHAQSYRDRLNERYTSGLFSGESAYLFVPQNDPSAYSSLTLFQYLQGRVAGLVINNSRPYAPQVQWRMSRTVFFLDEMPVDAATIALLNVNDIGLVKVFRPPFVGAAGNGPGGAIAVYTIRERDEDEVGY